MYACEKVYVGHIHVGRVWVREEGSGVGCLYMCRHMYPDVDIGMYVCVEMGPGWRRGFRGV